MKVVHRDLKNGEIVLLVESDDDLWAIDHIIGPGDMVFASTYRKEERASDKLRPEKSERKRIYAGIRIESTEFHQFSGNLRIHGIIEEAPFDTGSYHTLIVDIGSKLKVIKRFSRLHVKLIDESVADSGRPDVAFASLDDEKATIAVMTKRGIQKVCDIGGPGSGKQFASKGDDTYFREIARTLEGIDVELIVILGPGFTKESFTSYIRENKILSERKLHTESAGAEGLAGINEVLRKGSLARFVENSRTGEEIESVEKVMTAISSGGMAAYGRQEVLEALKAGAVEELLILDSEVRERSGEELYRLAKETGARTRIISSGHEGGRRLEGLGGTAAMLRYRM